MIEPKEIRAETVILEIWHNADPTKTGRCLVVFEDIDFLGKEVSSVEMYWEQVKALDLRIGDVVVVSCAMAGGTIFRTSARIELVDSTERDDEVIKPLAPGKLG